MKYTDRDKIKVGQTVQVATYYGGHVQYKKGWIRKIDDDHFGYQIIFGGPNDGGYYRLSDFEIISIDCPEYIKKEL